MIKNLGLFILGLAWVPCFAGAAENWKGTTSVKPLEIGMMSGMAIYGSDTAWSLLPAVSHLIKDRGFASDLDNRVWVEGQLGPSFFVSNGSTQTGVQYSGHLRWDFNFNERWMFYGLGGLGGFVLPRVYSSSFTIHPRFGAGAEFQTKAALKLRAEASAEFIGIGAAVQL
jgi:hypothetical protein